LKALRSKAFKITIFLFWHEEMEVSAPGGGTNPPSRIREGKLGENHQFERTVSELFKKGNGKIG